MIGSACGIYTTSRGLGITCCVLLLPCCRWGSQVPKSFAGWNGRRASCSLTGERYFFSPHMYFSFVINQPTVILIKAYQHEQARDQDWTCARELPTPPLLQFPTSWRIRWCRFLSLIHSPRVVLRLVRPHGFRIPCTALHLSVPYRSLEIILRFPPACMHIL